ncbi:MAG: hypothetical protein RLZZ299_703 [Pseudomonadota bacterium]|jgi:hypothetical protein
MHALYLLLACTPDPALTREDGVDTAHDPAGGPDDTAGGAPGRTDWTLLLYMDADNDLENYVAHDFEELESGLAAADGARLTVLVQVDRADGYADDDGDWTGTRRYRIRGDTDPDHRASELLEDLGEVDMGDPDTLAAFLAWGDRTAPATHTALVLWNHGTSWSRPDPRGAEGGPPPSATPPPGIAWDDQSQREISIAEGDLARALAGRGAGPLDLLAFDACNMGAWEIAHDLAPYAAWMVAAETWVGGEGLMYTPWLPSLARGASPREAALQAAQDAVEQGGERTYAAYELARVAGLDAALDGLAGAALEDPDVLDAFLAARRDTRGAERERFAYLDVADLARQLALHPRVADHAPGLEAARASLVAGSWTAPEDDWLGGVAVYADTWVLPRYARGSWARATRWDELLTAIAAREGQAR